jgi:hypothetical protein
MTAPTEAKTLYKGDQASTSLYRLRKLETSSSLAPASSKLPITSLSRLAESSTDKQSTILYLAYGSNLSAETFKGNRGIKPVSAVNVHVPSLDLTFDLPGIPYKEPCFANTRYRRSPPYSDDYHKDRWHKGLIGVVYEVTPEDYRTIIATEGGGASYQDVIVPCYVIPPGTKQLDPDPIGTPFEAHTLFAPANRKEGGRGISRPDPSYAQASARYLKLITDGAEEHELPEEYISYLYNIRPYTITTVRQRIGQVLFLGFWVPFVLLLFGLARTNADKDGKIPKWLVKLQGSLFEHMWASYDNVYKKAFGDGERTMTDGHDEEAGVGIRWHKKDSKLDGAF